MKSWWVKALCPGPQHFDWYFAYGGVSTDQVKTVEVALHEPGQYVRLEGEKLDEVIEVIREERERAIDLLDNAQLRVKEGVTESWLFDGPRRAVVLT